MKYVYSFDEGYAEERPVREVLGGKGAGLIEMTRLGIPVPPGFTISTDVCVHYREARRAGQKAGYPEGVEAAIEAALKKVEGSLERRLGDAGSPLLVSVRSGARTSMPGMMDTILNLGLNDETVEGLAAQSGDARFAYDAYRRLLQMYGDVVLEVPHHHFETALSSAKEKAGDRTMIDAALSPEALKELVVAYKAIIAEHGKAPFPEDTRAQLWGAIAAVFDSWDNARAIRYRRMQSIPGSWGTACTVQAMVFGNLGETSGSGVAFTRNPSTGARILYGEYLPNAQGEDVVAGIRTPMALTAEAAAPGKEDQTLERTQPDVFEAITTHCATLENHFGDMQDVEFTVERGKAFILQTRTGKRTAAAALRIAVELVGEGAIDRARAVCQVDPSSLDQLLHARLP
ncbi:MAG: PEP/pyruvate-binding domain-containing protein, partial [Myxococcota bacterium]